MEPITTSISDAVKWVVEKVAMPVILFFFGYRSARKSEARQDVFKERERYLGEERRSDEMQVRMQEEFTRRWQQIEKYWTEQNDYLRDEVRSCRDEIILSRKREDECEAREDALQQKLARFRRWAVSMVTAWNLQFPDRPMELPPENGNGYK